MAFSLVCPSVSLWQPNRLQLTRDPKQDACHFCVFLIIPAPKQILHSECNVKQGCQFEAKDGDFFFY